MKHLHPFIVLLLTTSLYAQTSEIIFSDVDFFGNSMAIHGDELYFPTETHIQKIDLTQTDPSAVQVLEVVEADNLVFHGDDLYFNTGSTVSKIDVTDQSPAAIDVVTSGLDDIYGMAFKGDVLFIADGRFENSMEISDLFKIDVSGSETTPTHVIDGPEAILQGLAFYGNGNELHFISSPGFSDHKILKIDVSQIAPTTTEVVTNLSDRPENIAFDGNDLYISFFNKIVKADVTEDSPTTTDVITITNPRKLLIHGEFLYIGSHFTDDDNEDGIGRITKYTDATLALETTQTNALRIYPNPVQKELHVLGVNTQQYTIYNLLGVASGQGTIANGGIVPVSDLPKGLYVLKLEGGQALKFLKE